MPVCISWNGIRNSALPWFCLDENRHSCVGSTSSRTSILPEGAERSLPHESHTSFSLGMPLSFLVSEPFLSTATAVYNHSPYRQADLSLYDNPRLVHVSSIYLDMQCSPPFHYPQNHTLQLSSWIQPWLDCNWNVRKDTRNVLNSPLCTTCASCEYFKPYVFSGDQKQYEVTTRKTAGTAENPAYLHKPLLWHVDYRGNTIQAIYV